MNEQINRVNILSVNYRVLDKPNRVIYRKKLAEICSWDSEKTFYNKIKNDYRPSPIEELASKMILDEIQNN